MNESRCSVHGGVSSHDADLLANCVHCGLCLEVCPTYQLSGDENNSPRGRLRLWRAEAEGRLAPDAWTTHYTAACVGCLACEPACPANVPYGEILAEVRSSHVQAGRVRPELWLRMAAWLAERPRWMNAAFAPLRWWRHFPWQPHRLLFRGRPAVSQSTAAYARAQVERYKPTGPRVALFVGCLMEAVFREINFATVRVLVENNVQVVVPEQQSCCGALHEHAGLSGGEQLREQNRQLWGTLPVEAVVTNAAGCGLALQQSLGNCVRVRDVLELLAELGPVVRERKENKTRVYVDLPCHLVHGQRVSGISPRVLDATGYAWELAPRAHDCCGSGGVYNLRQEESARSILAGKADFLNDAQGEPTILATSNHVCMMQWHAAAKLGLVQRPYLVKHVIELLDPGE